jgi:hypothetical protein
MDKNSISESDPKRGSDMASDAAAEFIKIKKAGMNARDEISSYVKKEPLAAVAIAVGTGFVFGSIVGSRLGRFALMAAAGYVVQEMMAGALEGGRARKLVADEASKLTKGSKRAS